VAAMGTTWPTLIDVTRRLEGDDKRLGDIAEVLSAVNPIYDDMPFFEGNQSLGHQGTIRTGLPPVAWRLLNYGTLPGKSTTKQVTDNCGILEAYSRIDDEVFKINGASDAFRADEDMATMESMAQEIAATIFYGNTEANPERFLGLSGRFSTLAAYDAKRVVDCGGTGSDNTSVWIVAWGRRTIHGIFPKGQKAGLEYENKGRMTWMNDDGRAMEVHVSHFLQRAGIHVKDWAGVVRMANIDVSDLGTAFADSGDVAPNLLRFFVQAKYRLPARLRSRGILNRVVAYCNSTVMAGLEQLALKKTISQLTIETVREGVNFVKYMGIPIRECDALLNTEARVV
jgi:hypothetical protein